MVSRLPKLSPQEQRVLAMIGKGYSTPLIAERLGVSRGMAAQHVHHVIELVKQRGRFEAGEEARLTPRQQQVAVYLRRGASDPEIATELGLGVRTVETHVAAVLRKLNLRSRNALRREP